MEILSTWFMNVLQAEELDEFSEARDTMPFKTMAAKLEEKVKAKNG